MAEYIDMETGEILDSKASSSFRTTSVKRYIGMETKWPSECLTADHLIESLSQLDHYVTSKATVDYELLNEHLMLKYLTQEEWSMLHWLCQNLSGWNYWIGDVSDLDKAPHVSRARRAITALTEKGLLRIMHKDKPFRGNRVFRIHPAMAWRGGHFFRNTILERWTLGGRNEHT